MRPKAIPQAVAKVATNKWVLIGGAGVMAVAAVLYFRAQAPVADPATSADGGGYLGSGLSYGSGFAPISLGSNGAGSSAITDAVSAGISGAAGMAGLLDFQKYQAGLDFDLGLETLKTQAAIAEGNSYVALQGIAAQNYAVAANVANSFINNPNQPTAIFGSVGSPTGAFDISLFAARQGGTDSKHDFLIKLINSGVVNKVAQSTGAAARANPPVTSSPVTSSPGTVSTGQYGGATSVGAQAASSAAVGYSGGGGGGATRSRSVQMQEY